VAARIDPADASDPDFNPRFSQLPQLLARTPDRKIEKSLAPARPYPRAGTRVEKNDIRNLSIRKLELVCAPGLGHNVGSCPREGPNVTNGTDAPADLEAAIAASEPSLPSDRLEVLRDRARRACELKLLAGDLEERRKAANRELEDLQRRELPDLFLELGLTKLSLEPQGNQPGFDVVCKPYYKANIVAEWPEQRRAEGFEFLVAQEAGDLIKHVVTVELDRGESVRLHTLVTLLEGAGYKFRVARRAEWTTLTAWLREQVEKHGREYSSGDLEKIGGTVGRVVEVKSV